MKTKTKDRRKHPTAQRRAAKPRRGLSLRGLLGLALGMLLVAGGTWALFELVIWNTMPPALVGKWVVTQGPQQDATFEFYRNGTLIGHVNLEEEHRILKARIRVDGDKIYATTQHPVTGEDLTRVQTIRKLTAQKLVLGDERGELLVMERAE